MAFVKFSSCSINFHLFSNQKSNLLFNLLKCYSNIAELFSCGNEVSYKFNFLIIYPVKKEPNEMVPQLGLVALAYS